MLKLIGCDVLEKETEALITELGVAVDCTWLEYGLHDDVDRMRAAIGAELAAADRASPPYEAILLVYGLCSNGTAGLRASSVPLVLPRCHDCISLFLGSSERYRQEHDTQPGTYWYSRGFLKARHGEGGDEEGMLGFAGGDDAYSASRRAEVYRDFVEKYGEDNAAFLMETWVDAWRRHYTRAVFVSSAYAHADEDRDWVCRTAATNGWAFQEVPLNDRLLRRLLLRDWGEDEFLVVPPGRSVLGAHDGRIVVAG